MDEKYLEMANDLDTAQRDFAIAAASRAAAPETHPDFDGTHCVRCDDEIPPGRLALGKVRCVMCQTYLEQKNANQT